MPQVGAAIAGVLTAFKATAVGTWLTTTFTGRLLMSVALTGLQTAFMAPHPAPAGITTSVRATGGTNYCGFILGRYATAGDEVCPPMSHGKVGSTPNAYLTYVIALGDVPGQTLNRVAIDGGYVELGSTPHPEYGLPVLGKYTDFAWVKYYDGTQTTCDPMLLSKYDSYPERPWQSDMVGTGVPYAICTFRYSRKRFQGLPEVLFECGGIKLYDPRKDSTVGGSGAHRWGNTATWEPSENNGVIAYNIARGITMPSKGIWGGKFDAEDLPLSNWFAAMNACDVSTGTPAQPAFRAGYEVRVDMEPAAVMGEILKACNGAVAEVAGALKIRIGGPGLPVMFITDDDIIVSKAQDFDPFPGADQRNNGIDARYPSPEAVWQVKAAPSRTNSTWETEDGERRMVSIDLPACPYGRQVQRVTKALIADDRRFRRHNQTLPPDAAVLEPLDVLSWTSARNGYENKSFELSEVADDPKTILQRISMREVDPTDYDWAPSDEVAGYDPSPVAIEPAAQTLPGWSVAAFTVNDGGGAGRRPALRMTWTTGDLDAIDAVRYQVRVAATGQVIKHGTSHGVDDGEIIVSDGIVRSAGYEARGMPVARGRDTVWTSWVSATSPNVGLSNSDFANGAHTDLFTSQGLYAIRDVTSLPGSGAFVGEKVFNRTDGKLYQWTGAAWTLVVATVDAGSLDITHFASSIRPVEILATLPATGNFAGRMVFLTTDNKLYRHTGSPTNASGFTVAVPAGDVTGQLVAAQIANAAINTAHFAAGIKPVEVLGALPATGNFAGRMVFLTTDSKLYRHTGTPTNASGFTAAVPAADVTGQLVAAQIANAALTTAHFASGITPVEILAALPSTGNFTGRMVLLTTENKLYRYNGTAFVASVPAADVTGQLVSSQIADAAITTAKFAAGIEPVEILAALPATGNFAGRMVFLTTDSKLYRHAGTPTNASGFTAAVPAADVTGQLVAAQIANAALTTAHFASGITPVEILGALPSTGNFTGRMVLLTTDNKLYRYNGTAFVASVPAADVTGQLVSSQIADAAITTAKFAAGIEPVEILAALPATGNFAGRMVFLTTDSKLYRHTGTPTNASGFTAAVPAADVTGQLVAAQIANAALTTAHFASGITPVEILAALPSTGNFTGRMVLLTTDNKLYRYNGSAFVASVPASDVTGQLVSSQIADAAITTAKFAAGIEPVEILGALPATGNFAGRMVFLTTNSKLYRHTGSPTNAAGFTVAVDGADIVAGSIVAGKIAAGAIGATEMASRSILATKVVLSDAANHFPDFDMMDSGFYGSSTGAVPGFVGTTSVPLGARYVSLSANAADQLVETGWFAVDPSTDYLISGLAWLGSAGGGLGTATLSVELGTLASDGVTVTPIAGSAVVVRSAVNQTFGGTGSRGEVTVVTGSTCRRMRFIGQRLGDANPAAGNFGGFRVHKRAAGSLIVDGAITAAKIAANTITAAQIAAGTITATQIAADTITAGQIAAGAIAASELAAGAVTTAKLAAGAVTANEIAAGAITTAKLAAGAVTANEIAANAVVAGKIAAGSVSAAEIAAGAILATKVAISDTANLFPDFNMLDGGFYASSTGGNYGLAATSTANAGQKMLILEPDAAAQSVETGWFTIEPNVEYLVSGFAYTETATAGSGTATLSIETASLSNVGVLTSLGSTVVVARTDQISSSLVSISLAAGSTARRARFIMAAAAGGTGDTRFGGLRFQKKAAGSLIVDGAITAAKIAANTITAAQIAAGTITATQIATDTITAAQIAAGAIAASELAAGAVTTAKLAAGAVTANEIAAGAVTTAKLAAGAVTANEIAANTITAAKIAADTITAGQIAAGAIGASEVAADAITASKLSILARSLINNPSASASLIGWGGVLDDGSGGNAIQTYDATEGALALTGSGDLMTRCTSFAIDPGKIYRVAFKVRKDAAVGSIYVGLSGYTVPTTGVAAASASGGGSQVFTPYDASRAVQTALSNVYFIAGTAAYTSYIEHVVYLIGANRSIDDVPNHAGNSSRPYVLAPATAKHAALRFLNWTNGTTTTRLWVKDVSVTEVGTGQIVAANIVAGAITTAKIAAGAVTASEIAADTITAAQIAAGAISASELAAGAVTTAKLAAGAVTANEIAANTITAAQIAAGTITATQIAADTITAGQIAAGAIAASELAAGAVTTAKLAAGAVTANEIAAGAITTAKLAAGAVTANEIASNTITGGKIAAGAIGATEIAAGVISATKIAAGAVTTAKLAAGAVTANEIAANTITGGLLAASGIITTAAQIADAVINNAHITGSIQSDDYVSGSVGWKINKNGTAVFNNLVVRGWITEGAVSDRFAASLLSLQDLTTTNTTFVTLSLGAVAAGHIIQRGVSFEAKNTSGLDITIKLERRRKYAGAWSSWSVVDEWTIPSGSSSFDIYTGSGTVAGVYEDFEYRLRNYGNATSLNSIKNMYLTAVDLVK